ncbi:MULTISPECIES: glycerol-3-phosphate 1-O-acyltransferase PlsY [Bacteroidota]|jgi:glycerol-3-phosphate acyltransferase PlsY|uniref:Glycerol-3-phosphate acyltransferase n=1 Tax=Flectobacillus rivi TaxID=2984209 RepID=A0ABT6Z498_9BACT|nr:MULTISPECIES: glycerol-3-phosphate 1-O-acyltransferase PlsY [Bacteroidota]MDI9875924.1 glycerol-3-phosphate 1-O-acyltransferase PlsY [Flectobacillus rivi]NBB27744.1 glycerol-3-phosphate 1-O-acyltransferase PlsY [Cellulophaga sp. BC115SP]
MLTLLVVVCTVLAYLLGSIPTAIWYGEAYFGIDVRKHGSGNAGATNTFRVLGKRAGTVVLLIDAIKGWISTSLALMLYYGHMVEWNECQTLKLIFGFAAVVGHIFPVFSNFKGGKGVATLLGMVMSVHPEAALVCMVIFFVVFMSFHYVSLGAIIASLAFPVLLLLRTFGKENESVIVFGFMLFGMIVITHRKNIVRLMRGQESRIYLRKKKE